MTWLAILAGIAIAWFLAGLIWWAVATVMTGEMDDPRNFWFVWRWERR